jgi:agmatine/peptidylarginine deiminase
VIGEDPFGNRLVALRQRRVGERAIRVEFPNSVETLARCQMVYVGEDAPTALLTAAMQHDPSTLLTVSSDGSFVRQGGMVALVTDAGRIRLHINLGAVRGSSLRFSAKLLEIAQVRHGDAGPQL